MEVVVSNYYYVTFYQLYITLSKGQKQKNNEEKCGLVLKWLVNSAISQLTENFNSNNFNNWLIV